MKGHATPDMDLLHFLRIQAHANALANRRLGLALLQLGAGEWQAPRSGFFPSLALTLNHILAVDGYYIGALHGEAGLVTTWRAFRPCADAAEWARRQHDSDLRLVRFGDALDANGVDAPVSMPRDDHVQHDRVGHVLAHLFNHQVHHRGQAHAMLSATAIKPPQLDEFMMPSEAHLRRDDMQALGWGELHIYGAPPPPGA